MGELWLHSLDASLGLVQQHRVERRAHDLQAVHTLPAQIRVEQAAAAQVQSSHDLPFVEFGQEREDHRVETVLFF